MAGRPGSTVVQWFFRPNKPMYLFARWKAGGNQLVCALYHYSCDNLAKLFRLSRHQGPCRTRQVVSEECFKHREMDTASQEFVRGTKLLTSLPAAVRNSTRHCEVAGVLRAFQPRPPLAAAPVPKTFVTMVVTDWSLLLISMASKQRAVVLLELPLLMINDLEAAPIAVNDVARDGRAGDVSSTCITLFPRQDEHSSQPLSKWPWRRHQQQQQQQLDPQTSRSSSSSSSPVQWLKQLVTGGRAASACQPTRQQQPLASEQQHQHHLMQHSTVSQPIGEAVDALAAAVLQTAHSTSGTAAGAVDTAVAPVHAVGRPGSSTGSQNQSMERWKSRLASAGNSGSSGAAPVTIEHVGSHPSGSSMDALQPLEGPAAQQKQPTPAPQEQQQQSSMELDAGYCLELITVERRSCLLFHIHQAWLGAHMRAALAAAAVPGLPCWLPTPAAAFQLQPPAWSNQQQQPQRPTATAATLGAAEAGASLAEGLSPHLMKQDVQRFFGLFGPHLASSARRAVSVFPGDEPPAGIEQQQPGQHWQLPGAELLQLLERQAAAAMGTGAAAQPSAVTRLALPQQQQQHHQLAYCQAGAAVHTQPTTAATREQFWALAEGLLQPASLFGSSDVSQLKQLVLELALCRQDQVAVLQQSFFSSSAVMSFLVARLTSWGVLLNLFPPGLPSIQNPAQPGQLEAWAGRHVVWATALLYPGRPRRLMKRLGLTGGARVDLRSAVDTALRIASSYRQAVVRAGKAGGGGSGNGIRQQAGRQAAPQLYHADPLSLSPLFETPYPFMAHARSMAFSSSSTSQAGDCAPAGLGSAAAAGAPSDSEEDDRSSDLSSSGTFAEATNVLRWERLVGRLAALQAGRKVELLLHWLQMQLAFTEGCSARRTWLSGKALSAGPSPSSSSGSALNTPWTFNEATQQLLATLLTLHLPHTGVTSSSSSSSPGSEALAMAAAAAAGTSQSTAAAAGPQGVDDMLWWAQSGAGCWLLDSVVGIMFELSGLCEQEQCRLGSPGAGALLLQVVRQVPANHLRRLVRHMFLRNICLLSGVASTREFEQAPAPLAAVLACKYSSCLAELLSGVAGCADDLHDAFAVEVTHLVAVPQVQERIAAAGAAAAAAAGGPGSVLALHSRNLLAGVLDLVGAAVPWRRQPGRAESGVTVAAVGGGLGGVAKVQN